LRILKGTEVMTGIFRRLVATFAVFIALSIAAPAFAQGAVTDTGYVLGPGDVIEVSVLGQSEFTTRGRVRADGSIVLPFVGSTQVSGDTSVSFAKKVGAALKAGGFYASPIVNIEIASYASRYVIVLGAVTTPGLQPVDRSYRVSEIIARAGGIRSDGAEYVIVRRTTGEELRLPFEKLASGGNADDPTVNPGDKVYVPAAETYFIYGQVNAPGVYPVRDQMTLRKAVARGGGLTALGSEKRMTVFRDGKKQVVALDTLIKPGDVIVIGQRAF
jgi:polysaccharide biosynthesis/export protein